MAKVEKNHPGGASQPSGHRGGSDPTQTSAGGGPGTGPAPGLASGTGGKREQEASVQIFYSSHVTLTTELRSIYKSVFS